MTGDVIKSFLVGLGFGVDDSSLNKFNKSIAAASKNVTALYGAVQALAAGVFWTISKISEGFEEMGYEYRIIAPAINKTLVLRRELLKAYQAAGINIVKTIQASVKFNMSLAKTKFALEAIGKSVAAKFFPMLTKNMDIFRQKIYANMPKLQSALEKFITFVFKAFEATVILGQRVWSILSRVYDFFYQLHKATDGWSTVILGVIAAWKLLNLSFLATPLGMIIAGLTAILALYDDFQVWKEGGKSLFDWSSFVPVINSVADAIQNLKGILEGLFEILFNVGSLLIKFFMGGVSWDQFKFHMVDIFESIIKVVTKLWDSLKSLWSVGGALGGWAMKLFGDNPSGAAANLQGNPALGAQRPLGGNVSNQQQTNQNVQQQTNINVQGSSDAQSVGAAVASQQTRVNFDMVRNLRGATR